MPCCMFHYCYPPQDGDTPLYRASSNGHTDVVRILLENKADPNISDKVGYSFHHITVCRLVHVVVFEI